MTIISFELLMDLFPKAPIGLVEKLSRPLQKTTQQYGIVESTQRLGAFLAVINEHTKGLTRLSRPPRTEYERRRLGDRYYPRGLIQISGERNYRRFSKLLGVDLWHDPNRLLDPPIMAEAAGILWDRARANTLVDQGGLVI
jgi:predicted chitinase